MMSDRNLSVPDAQLPAERSSQSLSISNLRNNRNAAETSRAQLVSSDIHREPRRPSMTFEPARREHENRQNDTRRGSMYMHRGSNRHPERGLEERRASNVRRGSIHQVEENHHTDISRDSRVSNGHVPGERGQNSRVFRHPDNVHSTHYHQRPVSEPSRTSGDLPPVDAVTQRRRDFQGVSSARTRGSNYEDVPDKDDRYVVPALPMPVAIFCCVLNFVIPGFGSMAASLCVLCCAKTDDMTCGEKLGSCCTVFGIGVLQLLLVACFLIGWIWSCIWGITFIGMSASYYDDDDDEYNDDYYTDSNNPAYRARVRGRTPLPTPQIVVDQPYPGIRYEDIQRDRRRRRETQRRSRSRISLTPSNLIYPMRAPSNIAYNSPPPPYQATLSPPPPYRREQNNRRRESISYEITNRQPDRQRQNTDVIHEEEYR
ncbi:uncharacterized protein LOC123529531 [Mercenaria mercenaria]|uniref:uncharacterized protein LOC123529531 n=1 Tax=Mercenaria mercenaria TaxID=6596 RepID=UPI00234E7BC0|nr:uncharacterized protein LOC123529531 [Mercenaria mercenaria]